MVGWDGMGGRTKQTTSIALSEGTVLQVENSDIPTLTMRAGTRRPYANLTLKASGVDYFLTTAETE